ncbi:MAG: flagellar FlbD family protein [Lachnospira sp.]
MIEVTRLNDRCYYVNADLIETIEETPDTVITLTTGRKLLVKEKAFEIVEKVRIYKKSIYNNYLE